CTPLFAGVTCARDGDGEGRVLDVQSATVPLGADGEARPPAGRARGPSRPTERAPAGVMSFANMTRFAAIDVPLDDPAGRPIVLVVVMGTFVPAGEPLTRPAPIWTADVPWDPEAEGESSLRWPSDLALAKPMADVVVVGAARPPRPTRVHDV